MDRCEMDAAVFTVRPCRTDVARGPLAVAVGLPTPWQDLASTHNGPHITARPVYPIRFLIIISGCGPPTSQKCDACVLPGVYCGLLSARQPAPRMNRYEDAQRDDVVGRPPSKNFDKFDVTKSLASPVASTACTTTAASLRTSLLGWNRPLAMGAMHPSGDEPGSISKNSTSRSSVLINAWMSLYIRSSSVSDTFGPLRNLSRCCAMRSV
mmetsp:Transcript_1045/g.2220  ORF Transcript_1045/g.2220 Transcript_1045/m.2220 type:complete len:210 (+) Transcript_1045:191-820(+)